MKRPKSVITRRVVYGCKNLKKKKKEKKRKKREKKKKKVVDLFS